jgi:small subunit ribosomal protein S1
VDTYNVNDELEGKVTKVVTFGAFVEILDGVEGLVHISELAPHHIENPREIVEQGDQVKVRILEIDSERRRLSLSIKRVEGQNLPLRQLEPEEGAAEGAGDLDDVPELQLSEDVFTGDAVPPPPPAEGEADPQPDAEPAAPAEAAEPGAPPEEPAPADEAEPADEAQPAAEAEPAEPAANGGPEVEPAAQKDAPSDQPA